jgi:outer membrane beta-barrel protein
MRRVLYVMILALVMMMMPGLALSQEVSDDSSDGVTSASGDAGSDTHQSKIKVKSQKKKKEFNDKIVVIQRKPFMRRNRVELAPMFYGGINDSLLFQVGVGGQVNYHILEWLYVGVYGGWQDWRFTDRKVNSLSKAYDDIIDATDAIPTTSIVDGYVGGYVGFVPWYGKFSIFNTSIVHWDFSLGIGGGTVYTRANGFVGAGLITVDHRWYLLKWLSLNVGLKGWVYYEDIGSKKGVFTHWQAGVGIGFWLPASWTYESEW